jgi:hypothetical protein
MYGILAMAIVAILSLTVMRASRSTDQSIVLNEMATQASGVGVDVLEAIGRLPFDSETDTTKVTTIPAVESADELTGEGSFGGCTSFADCEDIDDFDGLTTTRTLDGFDYEVEIDVRYVEEDTPDTYSATNTFAKQVRVLITNPHIYFGDPSNLLTIEMRRVFTYQRSTDIT